MVIGGAPPGDGRQTFSEMSNSGIRAPGLLKGKALTGILSFPIKDLKRLEGLSPCKGERPNKLPKILPGASRVRGIGQKGKPSILTFDKGGTTHFSGIRKEESLP